MSPFARFWRTILFLPVGPAEERRLEAERVRADVRRSQEQVRLASTRMERAGADLKRLYNDLLGDLKDGE